MHPYLQTLTVDQAIYYLELQLLTYEPDDYVLREIKTVDDVYAHRTPLKSFSGTDAIVSHIARIIVNAVDAGRRMQTLDCLKVLRAIVKNGQPNALEPSTIAALFRIYKNFIFVKNEKVRWCVSVILKGQVLSDDDVNWLIENFSKIRAHRE